MISNYFKLALRNLWKDRIFTSLNIIGLSIAFSTAILLVIFALFELSFDQFHENNSGIYQVYSIEQTPKGPRTAIPKPIPFAATLQEEVSGIKKITRFNGGGILITQGENQLRMIPAYVDPDFFSIFSFPAINGDAKSAISDKSSVAITQSAAKTLFGKEEAMGKTINILRDGKEVPFLVAAILKDIPSQSSMFFDVAINFKSQSDFVYANNINSWDKSNHQVYLQLAKEITVKQFEKSTRPFTALHYDGHINDAKRDGAQSDNNGQYIQQRLLPIKDIHFTTEKNGSAQVSRMYPYLVLGIAFLIIFIACANFINMSIAKSSQRLREIGMRKTLGAGKAQLFFQFWGESLLVFIGSLMLGAIIANLLIDPFKILFKTKASFNLIASAEISISLLFILFLITVLAGGYPALLLSKLGTIQALKGKLKIKGKNRTRDLLIILQFSIAILLISGTLILRNQIEFMRNKDLGFNKEQVIAIPLNGKKNDAKVMEQLRNELRNKTGILNVTASNNILGLGKDGSRGTSTMGFDYKGRNIKTNILIVDYDYPETLNLKFLKGRSFSRQHSTDSLAVIINETMAKQFNEENPLNTKVILDDSLNYSVIGVVKDFHFQDLDKAIEPITIFLNPNWNLRYAYVKVTPENIIQSFELIKQTWNKIELNAEFQGSFLDENIERTFQRERAISTMITSGSIIAIVLSCIGLFAISLLVVAQRRKEIGIRKIVGASVSKITIMLGLDFLKLVGIAYLISIPIAWWFSDLWLQNYANRIDLNIRVFLLAGVITILIALATISFRTIKAAISNPIKSLRTE